MSNFSGILIAVLSISSVTVLAQKPPAATPVAEVSPPVTVRTEVSRTAVWPGDPITYVVEVTCPPGTGILPEDLGRDRLRVQGLDVSGADVSRQTHADGTVVHRATFSLASYSFEQTSLRIEPIRVRYYTREAGRRIEDTVPAGEIEVPPMEIALRSTLPDAEPSGIRDSRTPTFLPAAVNILHPAGIVAIALSFVPVALGVAAFAMRHMGTRAKRRPRRRPRETRAALEEIRLLDRTTSDTRLEVFTRLDGWVRDYLTDLDIQARSMTPAEIRHRIAERFPQLPADTVQSVLHDCHRALYGGPAQLPDAATLDRALSQSEDLLAHRVR